MALPRVRISGSTDPMASPPSVSPAVAGSPPSAPPVPAPPGASPVTATPIAPSPSTPSQTGPPPASPVAVFPAAAPVVAGGYGGEPIPVTIVGPKPLPVIAEGLGGGTGGPGAGPTDRDRPRRPTRIQRVRQRGQEFVRSAGQATVGAARNDFLPAFANAADGAARGLETLGSAGRAAGAGVAVVAEGFKAAAATIDAFVQRGRELSGLSPELAAASARADITRLQADLREAQDLGPQMAQLIENQAKAEATMRELWMPIRGWLLDAANAFLEQMLKGIQGFLGGLNDLIDAVTFGAKRSDAIDKAVRRIAEILEGGGGAIDPLEGWLRATEKWVAPKPAGERPDALAPPLVIPFVGEVLGR